MFIDCSVRLCNNFLIFSNRVNSGCFWAGLLLFLFQYSSLLYVIDCALEFLLLHIFRQSRPSHGFSNNFFPIIFGSATLPNANKHKYISREEHFVLNKYFNLLPFCVNKRAWRGFQHCIGVPKSKIFNYFSFELLIQTHFQKYWKLQGFVGGVRNIYNPCMFLLAANTFLSVFLKLSLNIVLRFLLTTYLV